MGPDWFFHHLQLLALLWLCMLLLWMWLWGRDGTSPTTPTSAKPTKKQCKEPKPFPGLLHKPLCDACERAVEPRP
jgi:hypothetical protein